MAGRPLTLPSVVHRTAAAPRRAPPSEPRLPQRPYCSTLPKCLTHSFDESIGPAPQCHPGPPARGSERSHRRWGTQHHRNGPRSPVTPKRTRPLAEHYSHWSLGAGRPGLGPSAASSAIVVSSEQGGSSQPRGCKARTQHGGCPSPLQTANRNWCYLLDVNAIKTNIVIQCVVSYGAGAPSGGACELGAWFLGRQQTDSWVEQGVGLLTPAPPAASRQQRHHAGLQRPELLGEVSPGVMNTGPWLSPCLRRVGPG